MKTKLVDFTNKLLSMLDVPAGGRLQKLVDDLMMDLQLRITDPAARNVAACLLAERVFETLMRAFAGCQQTIEHENKLLFEAMYRVFYTNESEVESLPRLENSIDLLRWMQGEFGRQKSYPVCVSYFRRYYALCNSLPQAIGKSMMIDLYLIALPYLAEMLDGEEGLTLQARRGIVIARSVFVVERENVGDALLLLDTCQGELFGFVPEDLSDWNENQLQTAYGILCKVVDAAPAKFYFPLATRMEQEIFYAVCEKSEEIGELSGMAFWDISKQERRLCQNGKTLPLKLRSMLKLHHYHAVMLSGGCLPEWDEL